MGEFMGHHAAQLPLVQNVDNASGCGHGSMAGRAACRKGVGLGALYDIDARHGQIGALRQIENHVIQRAGFDLLRAIHTEYDFVRKPERADIGYGGKAESDHHAGLAANHPSGPTEQCR